MLGTGTGTPSIPGKTVIGYLSVYDADAYFATRLSSAAWTGTNAVKTAALTTAYDRLFYSGLYALPALAAAPAAALVVLKKAQCEMALYLLIHLADEDRRKGLQAQGVTQAGIVKETYGDGAGKTVALDALPIPPIVLTMLEDYEVLENNFFAVDIDRREDRNSTENVADLDDTEY
jgi:hypothetical protein